ncbi:MAG: hypothetical protein ABMA13_21600 [Chthoniobacteraceae bacterium]
MKTKLILAFLAVPLLFIGAAQAGPIRNGGVVITKPGKYVLLRNLVVKTPPGGLAPVGISIAASDVELDLAGFTIAPAPGNEGFGIGISIAGGAERVRIHNGRVRNFEIGVQVGTAQTFASDCEIERLHLSRIAKRGIDVHGDSHIIRACSIIKLADNGNGIVVDNPVLGLCEVSDCTIGAAVFGANGVFSFSSGALIVRRCVVQRFAIGYNVTQNGKLFDNLTSGCGTAVSGNPALVGANN